MNASFQSDPFIFYSLSAVSFLESTVAVYVDNLLPIYAGDSTITNWLTETWRPEEQEHGDRMATFVKAAWPEFDWHAAYDDFLAIYTPQCSTTLLRPTPAQEALARCVTECQASMIYKCIASYTTDDDLAAMLTELSKDEVRHYKVFRDIFDQYDCIEKNSFLAKSKILLTEVSWLEMRT